MRTVLVTQNGQNGKTYRAEAEGKESFGETVGKALDSLSVQLDNPDTETLYVVQRWSPDEFFTADQQKRMSQLMQTLRDAQNGTGQISPEERAELEELVEAELEGSARRAEKLIKLIG